MKTIAISKYFAYFSYFTLGIRQIKAHIYALVRNTRMHYGGRMRTVNGFVFFPKGQTLTPQLLRLCHSSGCYLTQTKLCMTNMFLLRAYP